MQRFAALLAELGPVRAFDYGYARKSGGASRRAPDKLEILVHEHRAALELLRKEVAPDDIVLLAGKSMGGRVGCHVSLEADVNGLVCFGYPLRGQNGKLRDEVLLQLRTPVLFVQGTRDPMCALEELDRVRQQMRAPSELYVVEGGDHSLAVSQALLRSKGSTQSEIERGVQRAVGEFCSRLQNRTQQPR